MVVFTSQYPDVTVPENLTTWEWLFESQEYSPLLNRTEKPLSAFIDAETKERLDWAQVKSKSTALSSCLVDQYGFQPGDTVTIFSKNSIWYPVCMFSTSRAGGRVSGASPAYTIDEMVYALKVAKTKIVFTQPDIVNKVRTAAEQVGIPQSNILLIEGLVNGYRSAQDLIATKAESEAGPYYQIPSGMTNREVCGFLNFSSGTTGLPKAVMLSHHNVIANCYIMKQTQIDPDHCRVFAVMPIFHITGTWRFCHYCIMLNGDCIILPTFTIPKMCAAMVEFRIDELHGVPPILLRMARDPEVAQYDLRHVKRWLSGAAPISPGVRRDLENRFPGTGFRHAYGCTETPTALATPPDRQQFKNGDSVGMVLANTIAKIVDSKGNELGPNQVGELLIKGPQVAMGYLDNEKATKDSFDTDGFYHTGDIAYFDDAGMAYVTDRIKELIKVKGFQVAPAELEDLLHSHEMVADCAVVGIPDEYSGELPKAYVVLRPGVQPTDANAQQLKDYVKENKVRYKWLVSIEFIDQIPKSPAGKILRRILRDRAREEIKLKAKEKHQGIELQVVELKTEKDSDLEAGGIPSEKALKGITGLLILQCLQSFGWIRRFLGSWVFQKRMSSLKS